MLLQLFLSHETRWAVLTIVRFDACVNDMVFPEIAAITERLAAAFNVANERPLTGVSSFVKLGVLSALYRSERI